MPKPSPLIKRVEKLEKDISYLASVAGHQGGELQAVTVALHGVLMALGDHPDVLRAVPYWLERAYASALGSSQNPSYMEGFEQAANLIRLALASKSEAEKQRQGAHRNQPR
jgi:hypothetical protein